MAEPPNSLTGQILAGTYRVEGLLGKGGMGAVYLASHQRLPMKVAIKVLHAEAANNPQIFARFRREAEIAPGLRHPNIVQVHDFNALPDGTPYLIMEFLDGEDLHARLRQRGRMSFPEAVALCRAVGGALAAAHKREVVHRDLKPQNIFLSRHEQGDEIVEIPKILDFGISKIRHAAVDTLKTQDQQLLGTPHYMSPEQARGNNSEVDHRTDQWALAAILYQCLAGRLAFPGDNLPAIIYHVVAAEPQPLRELCPEVPEAAEQAIRRALSKEREGRFASVTEFTRAFCGAGAAQFPSAQSRPAPVTPGEMPSPWPTPSGAVSAPGSAGDGSVPGPGASGSGSLTGAGGQLGTAPGRRGKSLVFAAAGGVLGLIAAGGWIVLHRAPAGGGTGTGGVTAPGLPPPGRPVAPPIDSTGLPPRPPPVDPTGPNGPPPVPAAGEVTLRVRAVPAEATVEAGGKRVPQGTPLRLPRGERPVEIWIRAPGHAAQRLQLVPLADEEMAIELAREPPRAEAQADGTTDHGRPGKGHRDHGEAHHGHATSDADDVDLSGIK